MDLVSPIMGMGGLQHRVLSAQQILFSFCVAAILFYILDDTFHSFQLKRRSSGLVLCAWYPPGRLDSFRRMAVLPCNWAIWLANLLIPVAILVFSSGFFPYKPLLPGLATFEEANGSSRPPAIFNKVIFMVVDALRRYDCFLIGFSTPTAKSNDSDFAFSSNSGFAFAQRSATILWSSHHSV